MNRADYIAALRSLAAWLEANPDVAVPYAGDVSLPLTNNPAVEAFATAAGVEAVTDKDGNMRASVQFGPISYYAYGYADWASWLPEFNEKQARSWATERGLEIKPREGGDES